MCNDCGVEECGCESLFAPYIAGEDGTDGQDNYALWLSAGNTGSLEDYLNWLQGDDGMSAYQLAVANGYVGTVQQWLVSIGAYGIAVANGYAGTEAQWLASLVGPAGTNGINAFTLLSASFVMPAVGDPVTIGCALPQTFAWAGIGQKVFITQAGEFKVLTQGTTSLVVENLGYPDNAAPGTDIPDPLVLAPQIQCSPSGERGPGGTNATGTPGVNAIFPVQDTVPVGVPAVGSETRIYRDTSTTPYTFSVYAYQSGSWVNMGSFSGTPGARILYLAGDPNAQPSSYGNNGDTVIDTGTAGQVTLWNRVAPGSWSSQATIVGVSASITAEVFRVGKASSQPIPMGSTAATIVQFELSSGSGLYNGGWWNGSMYDGQAGISAIMTFILENMRVYRTTGSGETIDFTFDILLKGVSEATGVVAITSPDTEGTLAVITTGPEAVDATATVQVTVTPSVNPTNQWYIDFTGAVLYNQT